MVADLCAEERIPAADLLEVSAASQAASEARITDWYGFHSALRRAALAATQAGAPLSLLMLELPGRPVDALARSIRPQLRKGSVLARYAEQRLAVIMTDTDLSVALLRAERIGHLASDQADAEAAPPAIGLAQFRDDESLGHLIERVDEALERARAERSLVTLARHRLRQPRPAGAGGYCPCGLSAETCFCARV